MNKIYIEIVNWPDGYGLTISDRDGDHCYAIAGAHGGGIGMTLKRFAISPDKLKKAIERVEGKLVEIDQDGNQKTEV